MQIYLPQSDTFRGVHPQVQQQILRSFLDDCSPAPCFCDEPCSPPGLSTFLPEEMRLNLSIYRHTFDAETCARVHGAWKCNATVLEDIYSPLTRQQQGYVAADVTNSFLFGLSEAVYSLNETGVRKSCILICVWCSRCIVHQCY